MVAPLLTPSQPVCASVGPELSRLVNLHAAGPSCPSGRKRAKRHALPRESVAVAPRAVLIAFLLALCGAAAAFTLVAWLMRATLPDAPAADGVPVLAIVGDVRLTVPAGMIRVPEQRVGGVLARLDLVLDAATLEKAAARAAAVPDAETLIFVSIEPTRDGGDPANRAEELYSRFLTAETVEAPGGLVKRRFRETSPYNDEELYLAAPDGRAFAARCGPINARAMPSTCLWQIRHGGLDIALRFSPSHLGDWQRIAAGACFDLLRCHAPDRWRRADAVMPARLMVPEGQPRQKQGIG